MSVYLDPRSCPLWGGADQHRAECKLDGEEHVRRGADQEVDWLATLTRHGFTDFAKKHAWVRPDLAQTSQALNGQDAN